MCGIAGIVGSLSTSENESTLKRMLSVIKHRGPDSNGLWCTDGFCFGMQRLSIIDLEGGDQPIWSDSGVGIVFNGEIYNFKKLRRNLEDSGILFTTHSDTEVILQLYLQKGLQAVYDLEGMFGICIYDPLQKKIHLIRDRLGVKPLYYYHNHGQFIFGSEIKSILEGLSYKPNIDPESLSHYLTLRYVPSPSTIWQDIKKLEPGHILSFDTIQNSFTLNQYWNISFSSEKPKKSRNYEKEFEQLFLEAVEKRLLASDVPVGILLSGGLDSSCVAAAAAELGHKNFHTFSIGFEESDECNELPYAKQVSEHIQSNHHDILINKDEFISFLDNFVWYSDEPLADLASIPFYYVSKLASQYVKVALSGEGADEILAGYHFDQTYIKLIQAKILNTLPVSILKLFPYETCKILAERGYQNIFKQTTPHITHVFSDPEKSTFLRTKMFPTQDFLDHLYKQASSKEPLDQLQQVYCQSWLVEDLLMKADKMSMATSLEVRVPFLDHKLVEWASRLPLLWKTGSIASGITTKRILRNFSRKRLPYNIINRPKKGFPVPAYEWLKEPQFRTWAMSEIMSSNALKEWIDFTKLQKHLHSDHPSSDIHHKIWSLVVLSKWFRKWTN